MDGIRVELCVDQIEPHTAHGPVNQHTTLYDLLECRNDVFSAILRDLQAKVESIRMQVGRSASVVSVLLCGSGRRLPKLVQHRRHSNQTYS